MSIAFAGGMILYIIYGETLPNAQEIWKGRLSTLGIIFGLIIGILIVSI
jgi:ZIP family zinc transporter